MRYLRMLDMPLGSIGDFLKNRDIEVIEQKLRRQKEEILEKQRELAVIERKINSRLRMISDARSSPLDVIEVKTLPPCRLVWVEKPLSIDDSLDMELPIRRLDSAQDTAVFLGKVGVGISRENLRSRKIRHRDQHPDREQIEKDRIRLDAVLNFVIFKLLNAVLLVELINTAAGIDQLLLAGVEGVALRADLDGDVLLGGSGLDDLAAGAADGRALVIGMDSFFHVVHLMLGCPEAEYSEIQGAT